MNRRGFLGLLAGGAAAAAAHAIPFNRVWSFPSKIVVPNGGDYLKPGDRIRIDCVNRLLDREVIPWRWFEIGDIVSLPAFGPERYIITDVLDSTIYMQTANGLKVGVVPQSARSAVVPIPGSRPFEYASIYKTACARQAERVRRFYDGELPSGRRWDLRGSIRS